MRDFIENKMDEIFEDFKRELDRIGTCCILKDMRYNRGNIPDYSLPIIQQLYLLRYFPAYLIEYYDIYSTIVKQNFISEYNVLSIGCGCGLDYYGLHFALNHKKHELCYTGVDVINWEYTNEFENEEVYFINENITAWSNLDWDKYNIIVFPKSIGEFSRGDFERLLEIFERSNFIKDKIYLVSSVREQNHEIDMSRLKEIINIFEEKHKFICLDEKECVIYYNEDVGLARYFSDFRYPNHIKDYITNLIGNCKVYVENFYESCEESCATLLNKFPILKTGHIEYQIVRLEKTVK